MTPLALLLLGLTSIVCRAETANIGGLTIEVPLGFKAEAKHAKDSLGDLEVNRWRSDNGRVLEVLYYAEFPKRDRGPMVIAKEEAIEVVGQKTKLIETKIFFGGTRKVFVVHLRFGDSIYIVDAERMTKSEFRAVLSSLQRPKKENSFRFEVRQK